MMAPFLSAAALGALFGLGLVLSFMTQPAKVVGFLDVFGAWDPTLMFVMMGAIAVHMPTRRLVLRRKAPVLEGAFPSPPSRPVDSGLIGGAMIFGVGWALAGYCPGPGVVAVTSGGAPAVIFVAGMLLGVAAYRVTAGRALEGSDDG